MSINWPTHKVKRNARKKIAYRKKRQNRLRRRFERGGKRVISGAQHLS